MVEEVAEAAVVPVIDELKSHVPEIYVALKPGYAPSKAVEEKVKDSIDRTVGKIARPRNVWIVPDMPKTRSGKIMRRVIAAISNFMVIGDVTTLANPDVVETILKMVQTEKVARGEVPKELPKEVIEEMKRFGAEP
ncbi:hypothetical protein LCGC14_1556170 [marine sediment metagenome]|uniref:AMP-binding enzyme C-terminal domain-containing protein n=1 Tax=marine sediment metagenome TaxID=412755 RepID=A0A0F9J9V8_9ZZZZ